MTVIMDAGTAPTKLENHTTAESNRRILAVEAIRAICIN